MILKRTFYDFDVHLFSLQYNDVILLWCYCDSVEKIKKCVVQLRPCPFKMIHSTLYGFLKLSRSHNEDQGQLLSQHGRSCPPYDTVVKFKDFQLKIQKSQPCTDCRPVRGAKSET